MATKPTPTFLGNDLLILNSKDVTYKITFKELSDNTLYLLSGSGDTDNSLILLNDINEINTDYFIKTRDIFGNPSYVDTIGAKFDGTTEVATKDSRNWILQYTKSGTAADGSYVGQKFVLADPKTVFQDALGDALQLDDLIDVETYIGGRKTNQDTVQGYHSNDKLDTFLLLTDIGVIDGNGKVTTPQKYKPYSLTKAVTDALKPNSPGGSIEIHLDQIVEINPNFDTAVGGPNDGDVTQKTGRLDITEDYKKGLSGAVKYVFVSGDLQGDEQLTYISDADEVRNGDTSGGALGSGVAGPLNPGWYYAEQFYGAPLEPAELANDALETIGDNVKIGGVRILTYKDTRLVDDPVAGGVKVDSVGGTPTNIGITNKGVLYSTIPSTLSFIDTIFIGVGGPEVETFATGGAAVPVGSAGPPGGVAGGPGFHTTPEDATTNPSVGDFYVVKFVQDNTGTPADDIDNKVKQLAWRKGTPVTDNVGSEPFVRNGDMVAWGGEAWAVIGTVNTETVAQDLQSVTTRGKTTDQGMTITGNENGINCLIVESPNDTMEGVVVGSNNDGTDGIISIGGLNFGRFPYLPGHTP